MLSQKVVQRMATDVEAVTDVLTLQTNVGIEPFGADGGVNGIVLPLNLREKPVR